MMLRRKSAVYSVVALMLCVAVYLNWSYQRDGTKQASGTGEFEGPKILGESKLVDKKEDAAVKAQDKKTAKETAKNSTDKAAEIASTESDYFAQARLSRQKARDEAVSIFKQTSENQNAEAAAKEQANISISQMAESAVREARIESLVIAKGYRQCVAFINNDGVNVIVQKTQEGLQAADVAKIRDIVLSETDLAAETIKVIETT